jgi:PGF-pre-PGF domain-containing protein
MASHNHQASMRRAGVLAVVLALALAPPAGVLAAGATPPQPPAAYYGQVEVNGDPAPAGVVVTAWVDGEARGTIVTDADGSFGGPGAFDDKLTVRGDENETVRFTVGGLEADTTVTWESGDHRQLSLLVTDDAAPTAVVSARNGADVGASVSFDAGDSADNGQIVQYKWSFGDGETASGETVSHAFGSPGRYEVTLTVTDMAGNTEKTTVSLVVSEDDESDDQDDGGQPSIGTGSPSDSVGNASPTESVSVRPTDDGAVVEFDNLTRNRTVSVDLGSSTATANGTRLESLAVSTVTNTSATLDVEATDELSTDADAPARDDAVGYLVVDHDVPDSAIGEVTFDFTASAGTLSEQGLAPDDVTLYRYHDGEWRALRTTVVGQDGDRFSFSAVSPGLSVFAIGEPPGEASFSVASADLGATEAVVGDTVTVSATISNDGTAGGNYTASLFVDGDRVDETTVTVPAGESRTVSFDVSFDEAGSYDVRVGNETAGTLAVSTVTTTTTEDGGPAGNQSTTEITTTVEEPTGFSMLTLGAVLVVLAVVVGLFMLARRTS